MPHLVKRAIAAGTMMLSGELSPKKRLPGTLFLPALPARPPRLDELDVAGVKLAMSANARLPRLLEVARIGRIVRTTSLFQAGHLLLRRGVHSAPIICVNGAADSELAKQLGGHPALQSLKSALEKGEKQVRHQLLQLHPKLKGKGSAAAAAVRSALTSLVAWTDSTGDQRALAENEFTHALGALLQASHWICGPEAQVLFAGALLRARQRLLIVAPQTSDILSMEVFEQLRDVARRGVKVELYVPAAEAHALSQNEASRAALKGVSITGMQASTAWAGFCCDDEFVVVGRNSSAISTMGRGDAFFGAMVSKDPQLDQLLRDVAITSGVPVTVKVRRWRVAGPSDEGSSPPSV